MKPTWFAGRVLLLSALLSPVGVTAQEPLTFIFTSTVDATPVGGAADLALTMTYTFAPDLPPGSNPIGCSSCASYGPIDLRVELGTEQATFIGPGTSITVFDEAGTSVVEDSYDVRADYPSVEGIELFDRKLLLIRFLLVDSERSMFDGTSLPLVPQFAQAADSVYVDILLEDESGNLEVLTTSDRPFSLTTLAPPAPKCASPLATIAELRTAVGSLTTGAAVRAALLGHLEAAETAARSGNGAGARTHLKAFMSSLVTFSNLSERRRAWIALDQANGLICGAANVLIGIPLE